MDKLYKIESLFALDLPEVLSLRLARDIRSSATLKARSLGDCSLMRFADTAKHWFPF